MAVPCVELKASRECIVLVQSISDPLTHQVDMPNRVNQAQADLDKGNSRGTTVSVAGTDTVSWACTSISHWLLTKPAVFEHASVWPIYARKKRFRRYSNHSSRFLSRVQHAVVTSNVMRLSLLNAKSFDCRQRRSLVFTGYGFSDSRELHSRLADVASVMVSYYIAFESIRRLRST